MCCTNTHPNRQETKADSYTVNSRREETHSIERRATPSDKNGKANESVRVPNVESSQRAEVFAWVSRCRSRISFIAAL